MGYIGREPSVLPITSSDLANDIVSSNAIADDSISEEHIDNTAITGFGALTSLADTDKFLVSDASDSNNLKYVENQYLGGGGLVPLGTVTTNNSATGNFTFDNLFSSTYDHYRIIGFAAPSNDSQHLQFQFRKGSSGSNSTLSNVYSYIHFGARIDNGGGVGSDLHGDYNGPTAKISPHGVQLDSAASHTAFDMVLSDPNTNLMHRSNWHGTVTYQNPSSNRHFNGTFGGSTTSNPNATGITFSYDAHNIQYGRITVYGVKHA